MCERHEWGAAGGCGGVSETLNSVLSAPGSKRVIFVAFNFIWGVAFYFRLSVGRTNAANSNILSLIHINYPKYAFFELKLIRIYFKGKLSTPVWL